MSFLLPSYFTKLDFVLTDASEDLYQGLLDLIIQLTTKDDKF